MNSQTPLKYTQNRMITTAKLATRMTKVARDYYGRMLTEQEKDGIAVMAEELAFWLPEDIQLSDVNKMSTEEILDYITLRQQQEGKNTQYAVRSTGDFTKRFTYALVGIGLVGTAVILAIQIINGGLPW